MSPQPFKQSWVLPSWISQDPRWWHPTIIWFYEIQDGSTQGTSKREVWGHLAAPLWVCQDVLGVAIIFWAHKSFWLILINQQYDWLILALDALSLCDLTSRLYKLFSFSNILVWKSIFKVFTIFLFKFQILTVSWNKIWRVQFYPIFQWQCSHAYGVCTESCGREAVTEI